MPRLTSLAVMIGLLAAPVPCEAWETPARGSELRGDLMDALRPHAEWILGAPVVFVVGDLRVDGDVAFGNLRPLRPGGREITRDEIPLRPGRDNPFDWDGVQMQALFQRSGETWVAVHQVMGATDVWWADPQFCATWRSVIPEVC